jgi:hypothetical protein
MIPRCSLVQDLELTAPSAVSLLSAKFDAVTLQTRLRKRRSIVGTAREAEGSNDVMAPSSGARSAAEHLCPVILNSLEKS